MKKNGNIQQTLNCVRGQKVECATTFAFPLQLLRGAKFKYFTLGRAFSIVTLGVLTCRRPPAVTPTSIR